VRSREELCLEIKRDMNLERKEGKESTRKRHEKHKSLEKR
jgi:hypothetical protein